MFCGAYPGDRTSSEDKGTIDAGEGRNLAETPAFKIEGGLKTFLTFKSCTPPELRVDKFSVLQFEVHKQFCNPLSYSCVKMFIDFDRLILCTSVLGLFFIGR